MRWIATWAPGPMRWELTVTGEAGDVALRLPSHALSVYPRPLDGVLEAMGMTPGDWEQGDGESFSAPLVKVSKAAEGRLIGGLLDAARGRVG